MAKTITLDEDHVMALYMAGLSDVMIAKDLEVGSGLILKWRNRNEPPSNVGIFSWQDKYKGEIPEKYRKPRVGE